MAGGAEDPATAGRRDHHHYWRRELLAYRSGLLDDLPGQLRAPRCLATSEGPGEIGHLWLAALEQVGRWSPPRLTTAARHLGGFGGAWLTRLPVPRLPWLNRSQLRRRVTGTDAAGGLPLLTDAAAWRHPATADPHAGETAASLARVWDARDALMAVLDGLPTILCHGDFHRGNLAAAAGHTAVVDWGTVGTGPLGSDLADLWLGEVAADRGAPRAVAERLYDGYVAGLHGAGWRGDPTAPRRGFAATAALAGVSRLHWYTTQAMGGSSPAARTAVAGFVRAGAVLREFAREALAG